MTQHSASAAATGSPHAGMSSESPLTVSVTINAPSARVWSALTDRDKRREWFFGVDTETDWRPGSTLIHTGEYNGKPYRDKGEILEVEPGRLLVHTHWSDMSGLPDSPENYQTVTFMLSERDGMTTLTLAESNFPGGDAREASEQAWAQALEGLKRIAEA
jgi:uncharacterized protein YndB with AHSA1/START domain